MTTGRFNLSIPATGSLASASQGLSKGILQSVTMWSGTNVLVTTDCWVMSYIADAVDSLDVMSTALAMGYLTRDVPIFWTGELVLTGAEFLVIQGRTMKSVGITVTFGVVPGVMSAGAA